MSHARLSRQLSAYLDGELTAAEAQDVRAHLAECDICRADLDELTRVKQLLGRLPERVSPTDLWVLVRARIDEQGRRRFSELFRATLRWPTAVATAALVVALVAVPLVRGRIDRLRAAGVGVDLYVREHALVSAADPFTDRAYVGLLIGDAGLALTGAPRGEAEEGWR